MALWLWNILLLLGYVAAAVYMIVNPDVVGQARGWAGRSGGYIDTATPGCMVRFAGCVMLAVLPGVFLGGLVATWFGVVIGLAVAIGLYVLANRILP